MGSNYDGGKKTKILIHGYTDNGLESFYDWIENMVDAYLENGTKTISKSEKSY